DDAFLTTKRPKTTKTTDKSSNSTPDFVPPSFERVSSQEPTRPLKGHLPLFPTFNDPSSVRSKKAETRHFIPIPPELSALNDKEHISMTKSRPLPIIRPPVFKPSTSSASVSMTLSKKRPADVVLPLNLADVVDLASPPKPSAQEKEFGRGLAPSPEKGGQFNTKKLFVRGGLAGRAQTLIAKSTTEYALWYRDLSAGGKDLEAELRLSVMEVLARNPPQQAPLLQDTQFSTTTPLRTTLTRCPRESRKQDL
ncbi:hypothetical protein FRC17_011272, partial [Serendipita sp. 399]